VSREYIDNPAEDAAFSLRDIRDDTARIASVLEDYLTLTMAISELQIPAEAGIAIKPLVEAINRIKARRTG